MKKTIKSTLLCAQKVFAILAISSSAFAQNIAINNVSQPEGNAGSSNFQFQITVNPVSAADITLRFDTLASGTATPGTDFTAVTNQTVTIPANTASVTTPVAVAGDTVVEAQETFVVQISNASAGTIVTNQALGQIGNDDSAVLSVAPISQPEGNANSNMTFVASLSNPVEGAVSVQIASSDGSANAPSDYQSVNSTLNFATGVRTQNLIVPIIGDNIVEADELFNLTLTNLQIPAAISPASITLALTPITGTLTNDDSTVISLANASVVEGNNGNAPMSFSYTVTNPVQGGLNFRFQTVDGTATVADNDYIAATGVSTLLTNSTTLAPVAVNAVGDLKLENNEQFQITLTNLQLPPGIAAASVQLQTAPAVGTITNDDSVIIRSADISVQENAGVTQLNVQLSAPSALPITVNFATQDQSALSGEDYVATNGTLTFAPNELQKQIPLTIVSDTRYEASERFLVNFSNATPAAPLVTVQPASVSVTILDDDPLVAVPTLNVLGALLLISSFLLLGLFVTRRD